MLMNSVCHVSFQTIFHNQEHYHKNLHFSAQVTIAMLQKDKPVFMMLCTSRSKTMGCRSWHACMHAKPNRPSHNPSIFFVMICHVYFGTLGFHNWSRSPLHTYAAQHTWCCYHYDQEEESSYVASACYMLIPASQLADRLTGWPARAAHVARDIDRRHGVSQRLFV